MPIYTHKSAQTIVAIYFVVVIFGFVGWVMNIVEIVNGDFSPLTGMMVARVAGVFIPPIGAVLGYF